MNTEDLNTRAKFLNQSKKIDGKSVLYVMSRDQRVKDNHALFIAQELAIKNDLPLAVIFCLKDTSSKRAKEHYEWMIEGLKKVEQELNLLNITFIVLIGRSKQRLESAFTHLNPLAVFFDFSPLRGSQSLVKYFSKNKSQTIYLVDTHNIVPVWETSDKQEFSARTIRPKIHKKLDQYLLEPPKLQKHPIKWQGTVMSMSALESRFEKLLSELPTNKQKKLLKVFPSGETEALLHLNDFLKDKLPNYAISRNDPSKDGLSDLSPYLHFGQLSSLRVVLEAKILLGTKPELKESVDALIEEIVVRKELSDNFCYYNKNYNNYSSLPNWAKITLEKHSTDERQYLYSLADLEKAKTHDPAWNACQKQMVLTGKMHGYMRMYWAKKVLEWTDSPKTAIKTLIYLNDFYSLDGGDPNGYVGILWSVGGLHDRPWAERQIYGTVRCMVYDGLKRKFDIKSYETKWMG